MRLSSIPRVNSNHRKRRFAANGSRMDTGVKRKWRLVRGRVAFECGGESRRENEDEEFLVLFFFLLGEVEGRNDVSVLLRSRNLSLFENLVEDVFVTSFSDDLEDLLVLLAENFLSLFFIDPHSPKDSRESKFRISIRNAGTRFIVWEILKEQ